MNERWRRGGGEERYGGGRDVSLEESYAGRAGRVARRSGHEPGGDTLPLGTSAETWEFHPEGGVEVWADRKSVV